MWPRRDAVGAASALLAIGLVAGACGGRSELFFGAVDAGEEATVTHPAGDAGCSPILAGSKDCCAVTLTTDQPGATVTLPIVAPGNGLQDFTGCTIDVTGVSDQSYLSVTGSVGAEGSQASVDLFAGGGGYPDSGAPTDLDHAWNLDPGSTFSIGAPVGGSGVFRFGADGNWDSPVGQTNSVTVMFYVSSVLGGSHPP